MSHDNMFSICVSYLCIYLDENTLFEMSDMSAAVGPHESFSRYLALKYKQVKPSNLRNYFDASLQVMSLTREK